MSPATPADGGDFSPMGSPIAGSDCPKCGGFIAIHLIADPELRVAKPAALGDPCSACPHCRTPLWLQLQARPPLARPDNRLVTALIPKTSPEHDARHHHGQAETRIMPKGAE